VTNGYLFLKLFGEIYTKAAQDAMKTQFGMRK
jgi:hypothetical protein